MKKLNQKGQGMTEYILIVALIAVAVIGVVKFFGTSVKTGFHDAGDKVNKAIDSGNNSSADSGKGKI
ncbi:MAG TPA: Flp family type IVb pilin [bacterium]|nr:Flp family type IVb pilin [bacterium]